MSSHGGKREGSGPKKPMSPYGEKTDVLRVPKSLKPLITNYLQAYKSSLQVPPVELIPAAPNPPSLMRPVYSWKIAAGETTGFKSPAQDYEKETLDLNEHFIKTPAATYHFWVGKDYDSMIDVGIQPGALLVVDCSLKPRHTSIVVAAVDNEWLVKRLYKRNGVVQLLSENHLKNYPPIVFAEGQELIIFGVVRNAINSIL